MNNQPQIETKNPSTSLGDENGDDRKSRWSVAPSNSTALITVTGAPPPPEPSPSQLMTLPCTPVAPFT